jgi:hypothetical protein
LALLARILGISTNLLYGLMTFFSFLLNFYLVQKLSRKLGLSDISATLVFLLSYAVLIGYAPYRPISPQINLIFYLGVCIVIAKSLSLPERETLPKRLLFLQTGLWFIYPYFAVICALTAFFHIVLRRDFLLKREGLACLIYVVIPTLPWLLVQLFLGGDYYRETATRTGLVEGNHFPGAIRSTLVGLATLLLVAFLQYRFKTSVSINRFLFLTGFSIVFSVNSQVLTGKSMQFDSHFVLPTYILFFITLMLLVEKLPWSQTLVFGGALIVCLFSVKASISYNEKVNDAKFTSMVTRDDAIFEFIRVSTNANALISAPLSLSEQLVYRTNRRVLATNLSRLYIMSDKELEDRVLLNYFPKRLVGKPPEEIYSSIFGQRYRDAITKNVTAARLFPFARAHTQKLLLEERKEIDRLTNKYSHLNVSKKLNDFGVDWLIRETGDLVWFENASLSCKTSKRVIGKWEVCKW